MVSNKTYTIRERDNKIDILKGIGIFLVVIGHVTTDSAVHTFIYSFHMPLFFILSGLVFGKFGNCLLSCKNYLLKKMEALAIPYFFWGGVELLYWIFLERKIRGQYDISVFTPIINLFMAQASDDGYAPSIALWFIPCLIIVQIIFYVLKKKCPKFMNGIIVVYAMFSMVYGFAIDRYNVIRLPWTLDVVGIALLFYALGVYVADEKYLEKISSMVGIILFVCLALIMIVGNYINGPVGMMGCTLGNPIVFMITAVSGTYCCYWLANIINNSKIQFGILKFIGVNSLTIMCVHEPIKRMVVKVFDIALNSYIVDVRENIITTVLMSVITLLICVPVILVVNKYFPILTGKRRKAV